jgi:ABC-type antimicrobial peptide transport system permease subunit
LEIGGSLTLLIVAGLFARSLGNAQRTDLGFDPHNVLNLTIDPHEIGYNKAQGLAFDKLLLENVRAARTVRGYLVGVSATDPLTYAGASLLLALIALAACYIPTRRAMRIDPMAALRHE